MKVYFPDKCSWRYRQRTPLSLEDRLSSMTIMEYVDEPQMSTFTGKYTFLQMNDDIQIHDKYRYFTCLS